MSEINNYLWEETPIDISDDEKLIWNIANKLRGAYMPDKYSDVIIPMTIIRRFECTLEATKQKVLEKFNENPKFPYKAMCRITGYEFYNTSQFSLRELCNDPDHLVSNFKSYISGFSDNVQEILNALEIKTHIDKMNKEGCLYSVIKAFSELDLHPAKYDSIKMGYIFESLIGRFFQNVDQGQFYTGRDIIKLCVSLLISEGCDDIFDKNKVITVCDQACGTGGMLSTAYTYLKHYNPSADVRLFGQEYNSISHAVGLTEMLIKKQNSENFRHADTFKTDCFPDVKMRFMLENPPFGTPWSGEKAKAGQEDAVKKEYGKGFEGRWGAGLPAGGDSQLLFLQSAIAKMDDKLGRGAIISNGSPLTNGGTASGESQTRKWLLENDLIEAIILLPTDIFYNTGIATYIWVVSKNKRSERKGKIQLIDASEIRHKIKPLGHKRFEFDPTDRATITKLYHDFTETDKVKIFDNTHFLYREYAIMQPLQRSYSITLDRIEMMKQSGALSDLYDEDKAIELEEKGPTATDKEKIKLQNYKENKPFYDYVFNTLPEAISDEKFNSKDEFLTKLESVLVDYAGNKKLLEKVADGLSVMDKEAEIQTIKSGKNKGNVIYDTSSKDSEIVPWNESIDDYMAREVLPHIPDAKWFWEEKVGVKKPVIKTGAEIPFTRYFYTYQQPEASEVLADHFTSLESNVDERISKLFGEKEK